MKQYWNEVIVVTSRFKIMLPMVNISRREIAHQEVIATLKR